MAVPAVADVTAPPFPSAPGDAEKGRTRLMRAVLDGASDSCIDVVLRDGLATLDDRDYKGRTALALAGERFDRTPQFLKLLSLGADPTIPDKAGRTPLHTAVIGACAERLVALLARLGRRRMRDLFLRPFRAECDWVPIVLLAARGGSHEGSDVLSSLSVILSTGVHPDGAKEARRGTTMLHVACRLGRPDVVALLVAHGADVSRRDDHGLTPLHIAARSGGAALVVQLLALGADASGAADGEVFPGMTAAGIARSQGHASVAKLLARLARIPPSPTARGAHKVRKG